MLLHEENFVSSIFASSLKCNSSFKNIHENMIVFSFTDDTEIKFMTDGVLLKEVEKVRWCTINDGEV